MATKAGRYDEVLLGTRGTSTSLYALNSDSIEVEVFESDGTTNATLYDDRDKTAYSGSGSIVTPDDAGNLEFFADPGIYVLKIRDGSTVLRTDTVNVAIDGVESGGLLNGASDETVTGAWDFTGGISENGTELSGTYVQWFNVTGYGALGDDSTDDLTAIQAAVDAAVAAGGGIVYLPAGTFRVSDKIVVQSNVTLLGAGRDVTVIKLADTSAIAAGDGVIMTKDFLADRDAWDYYEPYPTGVHMGVEIHDLRVDGNRANVTNGSGIMIYGGRWTLSNIAVSNCSEHGIWTEAGTTGDSTSGDDEDDYQNMHEATGRDIFIVNTGKHGWYWRGPNDSFIDNVQIKTPTWAAFYQDAAATIASGALKIGSLHAYAASCDHADGYMIHIGAGVQASLIYSDGSEKGGVLIEGAGTLIDQLRCLNTNRDNDADMWSVKVDAAACSIGMVRDNMAAHTVGFAGGSVDITALADRTRIGYLYAFSDATTTVAETALRVRGDQSQVGVHIQGLDMTSGVGVDLAASGCSIEGTVRACETGLSYDNTADARNRLSLTFVGCTTDRTVSTTLAATDFVNWTSDAGDEPQSTIMADQVQMGSLLLRRKPTTFTTPFTPDGQESTFIDFGTMTANLTVSTPTNAATGAILFFKFQQDGTGGRTISWSSDFKTNYSDTGNTAFKRASIMFVYDGTFWVQAGGFSGWL